MDQVEAGPPDALSESAVSVSRQSQVKRRFCFIAFAVLLVSSLTSTVIFFILSIFNILFVYIGVGCLAADLMIIAIYFIFRRCWRPASKERQGQQQQNDDGSATESSSGRGALNTVEGRAAEYRRLEREMEQLSNEVIETC